MAMTDSEATHQAKRWEELHGLAAAQDGAGFLYTREHFAALRQRLIDPRGKPGNARNDWLGMWIAWKLS